MNPRKFDLSRDGLRRVIAEAMAVKSQRDPHEIATARWGAGRPPPMLEQRAGVSGSMADAQKAQADLKAKVDDLNKAGQASWAAMSQALDDSRNAFSKAIEVTAKRFDEAAKG